MRKAAVIGHPVGHTLSPRLFGFWLKKYGIEGSYDAVDVAPENLKNFLSTINASGFTGVNITVPHKEAVLPLLDAVDKTAKTIGAVNTVTVQGGKLHGTNTDAFGFMENLRRNEFPTAKNKAVVLGAGGAARAVVKALLDENFAKIVIVNRTMAKAEKLAAMDKKIDIADWNNRSPALAACDLLVNTTTLGMKNQPPLIIDLTLLPKTAVVSDIVYAPLETPLLAAARARGNKTVDGLGMLLYQAVPAFQLWFGRRPDVDEDVRKVVLA